MTCRCTLRRTVSDPIVPLDLRSGGREDFASRCEKVPIRQSHDQREEDGVARQKAGDDYYGKRFRPLTRTDVIVRAGAPIGLSDFQRRPVNGILLRQEPAPIGFVVPGEYGE